jgi:hypothetical protein
VANREEVLAEVMLAPWINASGQVKRDSRHGNFNLDSLLPTAIGAIKFSLLDLAQTRFGVKLRDYG